MKLVALFHLVESGQLSADEALDLAQRMEGGEQMELPAADYSNSPALLRKRIAWIQTVPGFPWGTRQ